MNESIHIPIFPLGILPLPGELVPLHIFEPKYRDLVEDLESEDLTFGIFFNDPQNSQNIGGLVKLESVVQRYDTGESDIVVKCVGTFKLLKFFTNYEGRLYSGGEIVELPSAVEAPPQLVEVYREYRKLLPLEEVEDVTLDDMAIHLNLPSVDKLNYLSLKDPTKKQAFIRDHLRLQKFILEQEHKYKDSFRLN